VCAIGSEGDGQDFIAVIYDTLESGENPKLSGFGNCVTNHSIPDGIQKLAKRLPFRRGALSCSIQVRN
jgi:hypothetical protein